MKEKLELAGVLAFLGTVLGGFAAFLGWSGISADLAANYGAAVKDLFWVVTMGALMVACLRFLICYERLGGGEAPPGSGPREKYDALRASLAAQTSQEDAYARGLGAFLDRVDRFFGDADAQGQRALLLAKPAALWTARSYDRCLLLALIYPLGQIIFDWTLSGQLGPAERALGLTEVDGPRRCLALASIVMFGISSWRCVVVQGRQKAAWLILMTSAAFAVAFAYGGALAGALAVAFTFAVALAVTGAFAFAFGFAGVFFYTFVLASSVVVAFAVTLEFFVAGYAAAAAAAAAQFFEEKNRLGKFLIGFTSVMLAACFIASRYASQAPGWNGAGTILLFLGLLTLVNAPFDWASLGLTRLLLRYGVERGGPWPYALALIDALLAAALIALLAMAMVGAVDLFDHLAEIGGGEKTRVLPPMQFYLSALRTQPQAPEFWWIYGTLFSTMLPSVINLFIAGFSFLRGLPVLRDFLLGVMRENETMPAAHRFAAALILTLQGAFAVLFALGAQALLAWGVLWQLMPRLGLGVLDLAERIAM